MPFISGGGGGGGAAFNGGTITEGLAIADPDAAETQLTITGTGSSGAKLIDASAVHTTFTVDSDGSVDIGSDDTIGVSISGTNNTSASLSLATDNANRATIQASTSFGVRVTQNGTSTSTLRVSDNTGAHVFEAGLLGVVVAVHSAPADGSLAAGDCAIWFDQSNGASKLMVKGKSADGTVVAAAIALS